MKRIISVCIVLVLLNVVYVFTRNVGIYSSKEITLCMTEVVEIEIDYEIKYQGQDYLSILFYGMQMPLGLAHPSEISWGMTYDMATGQLVSITDVIELSELQTKMEQKEFESQRGIEIESYEAAAGDVDWFQKYMQLSMNYEDENHHYDFYLTKDKIGILYAVSHAIGDYIIVEIDKPNSQFTCEKVSDGCELNLYSKSKEKVFSAIYLKEPGIKEVSEGILQISISVGSPACYVFYFNETNAEISETFFNPIYFGDKYVAYMENEKLILKDVFDEGLLYKEIERDFTQTADPISAIIKIEMLNDRNILLEYYREDYVKRTEVIEILED